MNRRHYREGTLTDNLSAVGENRRRARAYKVRMKVLHTLPRDRLEAMFDSEERPWHMTRFELENRLALLWNSTIENDVFEIVKTMVNL